MFFKLSMNDMNNLSRILEESMSLNRLEEQAKEFDNQIAVMNKKKEGLLREINARRPTLMDKAKITLKKLIMMMMM